MLYLPYLNKWTSLHLFCFIVAVQLRSHVWLFETLWTAAGQASLSLNIFWGFPKFMYIALVIPSGHLIFWYPLFLLLSIFPSNRDSSSESSVVSDDQNTGASASVLLVDIQGWSPLRLMGLILLSKGLSGVFSRTHSSKASILWHFAFFTVQLAHDHWEDHSLDYMDICWQSNVSTFPHTVYVCHHFPAKKKSSWFHGCSHCLQWFWSSNRENLSLLPTFPLLFAMQ